MTRLLCLCLSIVLAACAPLSRHESSWGDAGEVAGRAILAPLTLGMSELMFKDQYDTAQQRRAYTQWYQGLSPDERAAEHRRSGAQMNALGLALIGGGPFRQQTVVTPAAPHQSSRPVYCTSQTSGTMVNTNCW